MIKQFDSQTQFLNDTDVVELNDSKNKCQFCEQNFTKQNLQNYEDIKCKTQFLSQMEEEKNKSIYFYLVLINENVNIHQLKNFIQKNKMHLRQIIIQHCKFYQNDLLNKQIEVGALRMLSEIDFNYMFEMFHFQDLSILELDMCYNNLLLGTTYSVRNEDRTKILSKKDSAKIQPLSQNDMDMTIKDQKKFIKEFDCEQNCKMMEYELREKNEVYKLKIENKLQSEEEIVRKLKWGESLDQHKFGEILLNNMISEIKFHLQTYKSYTKHSFNQGILLILGDVLKNQLSLNQLQNLIKINMQSITGVIFKANKSIPEKSFNQLMQYFLQIPNLDLIGFIGSVLNKQNFEEFQYLIQKKKVKYIVLYKSYFLINEINKIIKLEEKDFILNHQRYFIFDLYLNKEYEFTPFSFTIEELKKKQANDLLEIEQVYLKQQEYPKKISSWISYFQGKNLSILHNNQSLKLLQKLTDMDQQKSSVNEINNLLEQFILTDDMHYINLSIFYLGQSQSQIYYNLNKNLQDLLVSMKSYEATSQVFYLARLDNYHKNRFWQISALSILQGFSRIKSNDYNFLFQSLTNNPIIGTHPFIKKNKYKNTNQFNRYYNQNTPEIFYKLNTQNKYTNIYIDKDIKSFDEENNILQKFKKQKISINFSSDNRKIEQIQFKEKQIKKLTFRLKKNNEFDKFNKLMRYVLLKNTNLKSLQFVGICFDFEKFSDSDNNFLKTIEKLTFNLCDFKNDKFLFNILQQTTSLKKLNIDYSFYQQFLRQYENNEILNMEDIPKSLERLSLQPELIQSSDLDFYVYVLMNLNNLKQIDLYSYQNKFQNLDEQNVNLNSLQIINLYSLNLNILILLKWILKYSPNLISVNLLLNRQNINSYFHRFEKLDQSINSSFDGFEKLDQNNIQDLDVKDQNEYNDHYQTVFNQLKSITLKLNEIQYKYESTINTIGKKITKLIVSNCKFQSIQFFQFILQECVNLRYLKIESTHINEKINEKFDFSKLNIQDLQKFKFIYNNGFKNLDFPLEILKRNINNLKLIKIIQLDENEIENSYFINMFVNKMKLEELYCDNDFSYGELKYMIEKNNQFFNITDFHLTYSWDDESIKNEEINFFKVFDSSNLTIFQQIKKQSSLLKNVENIQQIQDEEQFDQNKNKILNKYTKYPPINFYNTFNISNNINNQTYIFKGQDGCQNTDNQKILNNHSFQSLQILKLKKTTWINVQQLINIIQRQKNLTDLIINGFYSFDQDNQPLNFNDWSCLNLRKIIIKDCKICFELLNKLFQSKNLEELKIDKLQQQNDYLYDQNYNYDNLNFSLISKKLIKLDLNIGYKSDQINKNINQVLHNFQELEFFLLDQDIKNVKFDNFGQNLQFFFSLSIKLNEEQVNQVFKKCQQLKVFEIKVVKTKSKSNFKQIDFDLVSKYLKKLTILKGSGINRSTFFFSNYFFENKIKSECDIYQKDQLNLLEQIEGNKNNIYIEITQQLIYNSSFQRFIQSKQIIGLMIQDFDFQNCQEISNFFNTFSPQLLSLKHLIIDNSLFYSIIYQNVNLNLNNPLESLKIINKNFKFLEGDDIMKKIYQPTLDNDNLLIIKNLCKNLKCLSLNSNIRSDLFTQILQNSQLLEVFYFIDYDDDYSRLNDQYDYDYDYGTNEKFNLDYSEVVIPQNVKSIVFYNFNERALNLIKSKKMENCDQLKILVLKNSEQYAKKQSKTKCEFNLKHISKNLEILKIKQINIEYIQKIFYQQINFLLDEQINFFNQELKFKLKRMVYDNLNDFNKFEQMMDVIDEIKEIKFKFERVITNLYSQSDEQVICFPGLVQLLQELKDKNMDYNYDFAIEYFKSNINESQKFQTQINQYLYFYLNSDFLIQQQLFYPFLIYSPFLLFQKTNNIKNIQKNYFKKQNFDMLEITINLLNKHQRYIFGFDQETFNQYSNINGNILNKQSQIEFLKQVVSQKIKLLDQNNIYIPYDCSIGKNELDELKLNDIIPPKKLEMRGMSIQFIKSWYAINYYAPLTTETIIYDYENSLIENSSIANLIQKRTFKNILLLNKRSNSNFLINLFNNTKLKIYKLLYLIFNQLNSEPRLFKFDHSVLHLEAYFTKKFQAKYHFLIRFLYILYLFDCAFGIWYFSYDTALQCGGIISRYSYIMYFSFGFITFIVEAWLFQKCLNFVSHLIPQMKPDCDIGFPKAQINQIKKFIIDIPWLNHQYANYSITFLLSQLSRFDFFTNIGFVYTTYQCKNYIIFYCALASISLITTINLFIFFIAKNLFGNKEKSKLVTGHIDIFYQICNLLSFLAVADILDIISPSNCVVIKGKMYNQRIIGHFFKILLQDLPLIVLQALQLLSQKQINETVILSIILSCITFLVSLVQFITLTPSTISQKEFDVLNIMKNEKVMPAYLELLSNYESTIQKYNIYEQLKCLKSKKYLLKSIESQFKTDNKILTQKKKDKQLRILEKFRNCEANQKSIEEMFGNKKFD